MENNGNGGVASLNDHMSKSPSQQAETEKQELPHGCRRLVQGCGFLLLWLYGLQCLGAITAIWHRYETSHIGDVQLTLRYDEGEVFTMFMPGIGALWVGMHWASRGAELHLIKALDIRLSDGREYTLHSEDYTRIERLGIRRTQEGIQLTDEHGHNYVDTPLIPYSDFQR